MYIEHRKYSQNSKNSHKKKKEASPIFIPSSHTQQITHSSEIEYKNFAKKNCYLNLLVFLVLIVSN